LLKNNQFDCVFVLITHQLDRFIPNRSAMDFDYAHYMLTDGNKGKENPVGSSPSREAYRKQLAESLNMNRTRILAFKNKPPAPVDLIPHELSTHIQDNNKSVKPRRFIPQVKSVYHSINLIYFIPPFVSKDWSKWSCSLKWGVVPCLLSGMTMWKTIN